MSTGERLTAVNELYRRLAARGEGPVLVWRGKDVPASSVLERAKAWDHRFANEDVTAGTVCGFVGDYSPGACALLLSLLARRAIVAPLSGAVRPELSRLLQIAGASHLFAFNDDDDATSTRMNYRPPPLVEEFRKVGNPGLIVFSSGSTGRPKAILHDFERVLSRYATPRRGYRTLLFLPIDHFGGVNTLFTVLAQGGVGVVPTGRNPEVVAALIEIQRVELVPVTPTFLRLFLMSHADRGRNLSSVQLITYGTEVMPTETLHRLTKAFPNARFKQTYGLSELGVLYSRSRAPDSLWMKVGGPGFATRIADDVLQIKSEYAMVGYLNESTPFDEDGWMDTQDVVEQDGEWIRVLGRRSDIINVGGLKVFPAEVEDILLTAENVVDVIVRGEPSPLFGAIVAADVMLEHDESEADLRRRLRAFCLARLASYKVPVRFAARLAGDASSSFKKTRRRPTA